MTALLYQRSTASPLYFAVNSDSTLNKTVAYLLPTDNQSDPKTLTLAQALPNLPGQPSAGCFIYLNTTDYDEAAFAIAARVFLWQSGFANVRFAWFVNPPQAGGDNAPLNGSLIIAEKVDEKTYQLKEASLTISTNFTLFLANGCMLTVDPHNENQLKISQADGDNNSIAITSVFGTQQVPSIGGAYIPGFGTQAGCIQFQFEVSNTALDENHLDVGLRYFVDDPNSPGNIISQRYPIFNPSESQSPINAWASLFLLDAFNPTRTFFSFNGQDGTGQEGSAVPTYFRTNAGNKVALTPQSKALAGFVFAYNPTTTEESSGDPVYNMPTGAFDIYMDEMPTTNANVSGVPAFRVMCGLSGVEYVGLMNATNNTMQFISGQNAYAPTYMPPPDDSTLKSKRNPKQALLNDAPSKLLAPGATTSWVYITPDSQTDSQSKASAPTNLQASDNVQSTVQYFAQPDDSVFYEAAAIQPNILNYMEVPAGLFPAPSPITTKNLATESAPICYPMVPYAGVQADDFSGFQALELQVLSPARRNTIYSFLQPPPPMAVPSTDRAGTTPQGRLATFSSDFTNWQSLTLEQSTYYELTTQSFAGLQGKIPANVYTALLALENIAYADKASYEAALQAKLSSSDYNNNIAVLLQYGVQIRQWQFTNVHGSLKEALQTNQLFLVITDPEQLLKYCSFNYYQLTAQALTTLNQTIPDIVKKLEQANLQDVFYASAQDYTNGLLTALTQNEYNENHDVLFRYATFGEIVIQGWTFNISPNTWDSWSDGNTILVFKFYGKSLIDLANDTSTWTAGDNFNASVQNTQTELVQVIQDGIDRAKSEPEFTDFATLAGSANWNGILILRAFIPLAEMPPQLQGIAAGINPALFYAHHIGVNITPIQRTNNTLSLEDSSLFGLIYYDDSQDLTYNQTDYQFKVLTLKVLFKNSSIVSFASQIELYINKLFGELAVQQDSEHGNNLILNGVYQKQGDTESYVFSEQGDNVYKMTSKVLDDVEILKAQFNSVITPGGVGVGQMAQADFILWGNLHFLQQDLFDVFSFGKGETADSTPTDGRLSFSNLLIHMSFEPDPPAGETAPPPTFTFDAGQITFDLAKSAARPNSLYNHFPLKLKGFIQAKEQTAPTDLGYLPIDSPLNLSALTYPWYALQFDLNLGGPGGLAAKIDFTATLVAAWAPTKNLSVFLGIKLPGSSGASKELTLESVLKLSIGGIEFQVSGDSTYMLKFDNIALKFFLIKFPPSGQTNIYLFGDPNNQDNTTLGWYAAYAKGKKSGS
jgi:hypothetical protein